MEAVLVSMSCFALLCEEAEIRCGSDEAAMTCLLPNYHLYLELAQASTVLITGEFDLFDLYYISLTFLFFFLLNVRPTISLREHLQVEKYVPSDFENLLMNV